MATAPIHTAKKKNSIACSWRKGGGEGGSHQFTIIGYLLPMYTADNHIMTLYTHLVLKEPALSYDDYNEVAKRDSPKPGSLTQWLHANRGLKWNEVHNASYTLPKTYIRTCTLLYEFKTLCIIWRDTQSCTVQKCIHTCIHIHRRQIHLNDCTSAFTNVIIQDVHVHVLVQCMYTCE